MTIITFSDFPQFRPNISPEEMFSLGVFGGTYWRPIYSSVLGKSLKNRHKKFKWNIPENMLSSSECDKNKNYFKAVSGTSLDYWESKGWINAQDPYGWVEWYCNFYNGRRSTDDERQIKRWLAFAGPKGRFRTRKNKSAIVKQGLLQWAYFTERD
uniref:Uncharacterized protein n=1 Tax=viral metagenome TaxID=1070528 RepID=A0A6C0BE86_9ZZZZ